MAARCLQLAFLLYPFYVFPSGGFQFAHLAILAMAAFALLERGAPLEITPPVVVYTVLAVYMFLVNVVWFLVEQDVGFIRFIAIGSFSTFTFLATAIVARRLTERDVHAFVIAIFLTVAIQLLLIALGLGRPSYRTIIYFNNPNQLGYFSALAAASAVILSRLYNVTGWVVPVTVIGATVLSTFSLSKGGIGACLCYCLFVLTVNRSVGWPQKVLIAALVVGVGFTIAGPVMDTEFYAKFDKRLNGFERANDDNLEARGYGRITDYPQYLVAGAGEGVYERFGATSELHSYPASTLFCYGIIGLGLLVLFWIVVVPDIVTAMMLMPLLLYNLTHNGGRVVVLWILFALIAARYDRSRAPSSDAAEATDVASAGRRAATLVT